MGAKFSNPNPSQDEVNNQPFRPDPPSSLRRSQRPLQLHPNPSHLNDLNPNSMRSSQSSDHAVILLISMPDLPTFLVDCAGVTPTPSEIQQAGCR